MCEISAKAGLYQDTSKLHPRRGETVVDHFTGKAPCPKVKLPAIEDAVGTPMDQRTPARRVPWPVPRRSGGRRSPTAGRRLYARLQSDPGDQHPRHHTAHPSDPAVDLSPSASEFSLRPITPNLIVSEPETVSNFEMLARGQHKGRERRRRAGGDWQERDRQGEIRKIAAQAQLACPSSNRSPTQNLQAIRITPADRSQQATFSSNLPRAVTRARPNHCLSLDCHQLLSLQWVTRKREQA